MQPPRAEPPIPLGWRHRGHARVFKPSKRMSDVGKAPLRHVFHAMELDTALRERHAHGCWCMGCGHRHTQPTTPAATEAIQLDAMVPTPLRLVCTRCFTCSNVLLSASRRIVSAGWTQAVRRGWKPFRLTESEMSLRSFKTSTKAQDYVSTRPARLSMRASMAAKLS